MQQTAGLREAVVVDKLILHKFNTIPVMRRLSDQSAVCSVLMSPFGIGSACLEPQLRWKKYQKVPKKNGSKQVKPNISMQPRQSKMANMLNLLNITMLALSLRAC